MLSFICRLGKLLCFSKMFGKFFVIEMTSAPSVHDAGDPGCSISALTGKRASFLPRMRPACFVKGTTSSPSPSCQTIVLTYDFVYSLYFGHGYRYVKYVFDSINRMSSRKYPECQI